MFSTLCESSCEPLKTLLYFVALATFMAAVRFLLSRVSRHRTVQVLLGFEPFATFMAAVRVLVSLVSPPRTFNLLRGVGGVTKIVS